MKDEKYLKQLGKMARPVPGSSLANDPEAPLPFEGAPEFTKKNDALEEIFGRMITPEIYSPMIEALERGTSVMEISQVVLFEGFRQGKWNPDMFLSLLEPTAYMTLALGERAGVADIKIDYEVSDDIEDAQELSEVEQALQKARGKIQSTVPKGVLPGVIEDQIDQVDVPESLLAKPQVDPVGEEVLDPVVEESLLAEGVA